MEKLHRLPEELPPHLSLSAVIRTMIAMDIFNQRQDERMREAERKWQR